MREFTSEELRNIIDLHKKWLRNETDGVRANLRGADLRWANLHGADLRLADFSKANLRLADLRLADFSKANLCGVNLREADLSEADLHGADLRGADLHWADLHKADLHWANLSEADLIKAKLSKANLHGANLSEADLIEANVSEADLSEADLHEADLSKANLSEAEGVPFIPMACPDSGEFIGWKKASNYIVKLKILQDSKRSSATGRNCRCDKALVVDIQSIDGNGKAVDEITSDYDSSFVYKIGGVVSVDNFDDDRWNGCAPGIHFFVNRQEAVNY